MQQHVLFIFIGALLSDKGSISSHVWQARCVAARLTLNVWLLQQIGARSALSDVLDLKSHGGRTGDAMHLLVHGHCAV